MINLLALFLIIIVPAYGVLNLTFSRFKLVSYLAKNHPRTWSHLRLGDASGEVGGYRGGLAHWIATREYLSLKDPKIPDLASKYHRSKIIGAISFLLFTLGFALLSGEHS
jgi:hypothetical protein